MSLPRVANQIQRQLERCRSVAQRGAATWDRCWRHTWVRASLFAVVFVATWILSGSVAGD